MAKVRYRQLFLVLGLLLLSNSGIAIERTQSIVLKKGWNAVFLEVDSGDRKLDEIFQNTPVDLIASYFYKLSSAEFIQDPNEINWKKATWNKWVAPDRPDAFLSNLHRLVAGRGYLIHSKADYVWSLNGKVELFKLKWEPSSFTLSGFPVTNIPPSVKQLVDLSKVHAGQPIYTLETNEEGVSQWKKVTDRVSTPIEPNKAYWIYTNGGGEYFTGAIEVKLADTHTDVAIDFLDVVNVKRITLRNASNQPRNVTLTLENNEVPLRVVEKDEVTQEPIYRPVSTSLFDEPLSIEAGQEIEIALQVDRKQIAANTTVEGLLKVTDDTGGTNSGSEYWVPIKASGEVQQ